MGLYTQRAPGFDGGKTAMLEEEELDDEFFMLRVRSDGELLDAAKLRALGSIGTDFARGTADVTDRENIQYHWIEIENVPEIWERLDNVGMTSLEACGDSPRPFLGSPVAGVAADEIIDATPALEEIKRRYIGNPEYSNLPRKFKTSASGHPSLDCVPSVNDVSFVGTVHPEHGPGFDLWVGGGLSTNPMLAQKLGVWIPLDEVPDAWEAVTSVFRDYGYRRLRSRARLKFLVADWGVEKFREVLETEYLERKLVDCPSPVATGPTGDHIGVHEQKDGKFYIGAAPIVGRIDGQTLTNLGDIVEKYGAAGARLTALQKIVVLGVDEADIEPLIADLAEINLEARPSNWRRSTMACTGIEFCKLAIVDTKQRAIDLVARAGEALPRPRHPDQRQRQRLPERLRPHPGRRHRAQGHARARRRRQPGRGLPGPPRRQPRAHLGVRQEAAGAQDHQRRARRLHHHGRRQLPARPRGRRGFASWAVRADEILLRGEKAL